jgi:DNA-binding transcriptional regulator GbsR (MarR family)
MRLVEVGGGISQDLGMGRIVGRILVYLYLTDGEVSLDQIGDDLQLSKAAVSVAVRQLEALGLVRRIWKAGDRRKYYRTADNIATALQQGLLAFVRQKIQTMGAELDAATGILKAANGSKDAEFLRQRVARARTLRERTSKLLESPLLRLFVRS